MCWKKELEYMLSGKKIKRIARTTVSLLKTKRLIPIEHPVDKEMLLKNKVALITGGSGGIGFAIAKSFLESGCKVIIIGTNEDKCKKSCEKLGTEARYIVFDLKEISKIQELIDTAISIYGKIDILVNSAGIHSTKSLHGYFDVNEEEFDSILTINLKATYFVTQLVVKYMVENKIKGHVLNISSSVANEPAWSPYRLSKWGIKGLTLGVAQQMLPYGITVNAIAPGSTATNLLGIGEGDSIYTEDNEVGRYAMPDEIATYAKLLVSDAGNMIVGDTIYISGGRGVVTIR